MTDWPTKPGTMIFLPDLPSGPTPKGYQRWQRLVIPLCKDDPGTGQPLPLPDCPFNGLLFGDGQSRPDFSLPVGAVLVSGTQHLVMPGKGRLLVLMLVRRQSGLGQQQFLARWLHGHAPFALDTGASGYRQLHAADVPSCIFDGAGLVFYEDHEHMTRVRAGAAVIQETRWCLSTILVQFWGCSKHIRTE